MNERIKQIKESIININFQSKKANKKNLFANTQYKYIISKSFESNNYNLTVILFISTKRTNVSTQRGSNCLPASNFKMFKACETGISFL